MKQTRTSLKVLGALAFVLAACGREAPSAATAPGPGAGLQTWTAAEARTEREIRFDGVIEAVNQATVAAQTGGRVVELPYDVGDYVKQGEVIVRITGGEQKAQAAAAAAAVSEGEARFAEAKLRNDRITDLFARGAVARAAVDQARADLDSARARAAAARNELKQAQEHAGYTVVRAPYSGIVVKRHVEVGETVTVGRPLMTGLSLEHLRAVTDVPQEHIGPLRQNRQARVIFPDGQSAGATAIQIPPGADPETHTFHVRVSLPQGDYHVFPGTLVKVAFVSGTEERLLLPPTALLTRGELTGVYVVDADQHVALRYVRFGTPAADGRVPVLAGLAAGERVALDPVAAGLAAQAEAGAAP